MQGRQITAAAIQLLAHDRPALNRVWPGIAQRIRDAAAAGAQLIVLPEGTLPAYVLGQTAFEEREIAPALAECAELARELHAVIVIGAARRDGERVYNSALVFDTDGERKGYADKHFLWHFDRQWFAAGERLEPVKTSIGMLGVLICADGRIPTIARALVDRGSEILVMPTAWVTSGRDPQNLENVQADLLARVRARENGVPFVAANKCGVEMASVAYCGKSQIVLADGSLAAIASQTEPEILTAAVEIGAANPFRGATPRRDHPVAPSEVQMMRVAITARNDLAHDPVLLATLEADVLVAPGAYLGAAVDDRDVLDPGGLAALRLGGAAIATWVPSQVDDGWQASFARARALELRMYLIVLDTKAGRAYAVDPDGAIVCGTYDGYEVAAFTFDPARTRQTLVAPGTDVREGLERAHAHAN